MATLLLSYSFIRFGLAGIWQLCCWSESRRERCPATCVLTVCVCRMLKLCGTRFQLPTARLRGKRRSTTLLCERGRMSASCCVRCEHGTIILDMHAPLGERCLSQLTWFVRVAVRSSCCLCWAHCCTRSMPSNGASCHRDQQQVPRNVMASRARWTP